jgi:hypothetical protein
MKPERAQHDSVLARRSIIGAIDGRGQGIRGSPQPR